MSKVIIYGCNGALGRHLVSEFKRNSHFIVGIDVSHNDIVDHSVVVDPANGLKEQGNAINTELDKAGFLLSEFSAVICASGGWAGGNVASKDIFDTVDISLRQSVYSSVISGNIASRFLQSGGFLLLPGACAALDGTPGMVGYGLAKAAVHHLVKSLSMEGSGLPPNSKVMGLLPITLDTPANRAAMPTADYSSWTPLSELSSEIYNWATKGTQFGNGCLVKVITENGKTTFS